MSRHVPGRVISVLEEECHVAPLPSRRALLDVAVRFAGLAVVRNDPWRSPRRAAGDRTDARDRRGAGSANAGRGRLDRRRPPLWRAADRRSCGGRERDDGRGCGRRLRRCEKRPVGLSRGQRRDRPVVASRSGRTADDRPDRGLQPAGLRSRLAQRRQPAGSHFKRRAKLDAAARQPGPALRRHPRGEAAGGEPSPRRTFASPLRATATAQSAADLFSSGRSRDLRTRAGQ